MASPYLIQKNKIPSSNFIKSCFKTHKVRDALVIYDANLLTNSEFSLWVKKQPFSYKVEAGEALKSLSEFAAHIEKINGLIGSLSHRELGIIACGGGSLGDFAGFVASVYKRGVPIVHMPTTWLAAVDSSHGGKTALNLGSAKNQIGSFHSADAVIAVKSLMLELDVKNQNSALSEWLKIGIIGDAKLFKEISSSRKKIDSVLWQQLPKAVNGKLKVVSKDPFESKGIRHILNLGHTLGHTLELEHQLPHGWAVAQGLYFATRWSLSKKLVTEKTHNEIIDALNLFFVEQADVDGKPLKGVTSQQFLKLLAGDKKKTSKSKINFVFIQRLGKVICKEVTMEAIAKEAQRQGWCQ